ncbi:MAG: YrzE family protein [Methanobacterium sp.]|nr:YrzE family protein [Methanobacterium sp.]
MGYLICDTCEGYYKLKPEESPEDFLRRCNCGGYLNYSLSLVLEEKDHSYPKKIIIMDPRIARLSLGVLIVLVPNLFYYNNLFLALGGIPLILGGFVSSIFTDGDLKDGALSGARVGFFSLVIYFLIALILLVLNLKITPDMVSIILSVLILMVLTSVGGLLGNITRKVWIKRETQKNTNKTETETTIINNKDPEEIKYKDEMVKLGYKQMSAINDGEEVFKGLLSQSISEEDALSHLKEDKNILDEVLTEMQEITPPDKYREYHDLKIEAASDISKTFDMIDGLVNPDPNKIHQTKDLVESSTAKVNQAITELHKTMQDEENILNE